MPSEKKPKPAEPPKKTAWRELFEERMAFVGRTADRLRQRAAAARRV